MIFFQNPKVRVAFARTWHCFFSNNAKHVLSTARTDEENRLHAIHVQAANKFEAIMEDEKYTADRALRAVLPLVPELATAYKIHLNPRHQYVLGVVRRLLEDEEFSSGYGQFKVRF